MTPFGGGWPYGSVPVDDPSKLIGMWSEELNRQASMIAYLNDFRVLAVAAVIFLPLLFFMRPPAQHARPSRRCPRAPPQHPRLPAKPAERRPRRPPVRLPTRGRPPRGAT